MINEVGLVAKSLLDPGFTRISEIGKAFCAHVCTIIATNQAAVKKEVKVNLHSAENVVSYANESLVS
jgi:hypothetical protein